MQKQKTIAKWLAIIMLCTLSVGSYLLYDVLSAPKENSSAVIADEAEQTDTPTPPVKVPYYTSLPREPESINGLRVAHTGGEGKDVLHKSIAVGEKLFAFFSSSSIEYDLRASGLSLAVFDNGVLKSVNTFSTGGELIDCKLSVNGIAAAVKGAEANRLYLFSLDGEMTAETELPAFDNGKLHLKDRSLWWFYVLNGNLRACQILNDFTLQMSAYKASVGEVEIKEILPETSGFTVITGSQSANNETNEAMTIGHSFEPYRGFKLLFSYDKLHFKQIIVIGSNDGASVILYGDSGKPTLITFDKNYKVISTKTVEGCRVGVCCVSGDGLRFLADGLTLTMCKHLDVLLAENNPFTFDDIVAYDAVEYRYLLVKDDDNTPNYSLVSTDENAEELLSLPDCNAPCFFSGANGIEFVCSSTLSDAYCRANFGLEDVFCLSLPLFLDIDT